MKRHIVAALMVGLVAAADAPREEAARAELKRLEGQWQLIDAERDGKPIPADDFKTERVAIKGDQLTITVRGKFRQRSTLTVDPTTRPRGIARAVTEGAFKGKKEVGIYELKGDTLRLCWVSADRERPKAFTSKGRGVLLVYKRVKP